VRWRIERPDGKPMGIAGLWERQLTDDGLPSWSMTLLTINADNDPVFKRFHKPDDENRLVVILPDDAWGDWLRCRSDREALAMLTGTSIQLNAVPDPR
jgi:putative SOS response-associated peptidase YedK